MIDELTLPASFAPMNLRLPPDRRPQLITSDVYNICERLREISRRLLVNVCDPGNGQRLWYTIVELCDDGVERMVFNVWELDDRAVKRIEVIMSLPAEVRYEQIQARADRWEREKHENDMDELYERLGRPMWSQLEHDGFIDGRGLSFPKRGVTGGKGSRARS